MEIVLFILAGISVLVSTVLAQRFVANWWHCRKLNRVARRFNGQLRDVRWFELPTIQLRLGQFEALVVFHGSEGAESETHFRVAWPDKELECEVRQPGVLGRILNLLMARPMPLAAPLLDDTYVVTGNDEPQIRRLLSARAQSLLIQLSGLAPFPGRRHPDVRLTVEGGLFTVSKPSHITHEFDLEQFIRLCAELHGAALDSTSGGVVRHQPIPSKSCA